MLPHQWFDLFKSLIDKPEDEIDLAQAALVIAADEYPELDVAAYLARLDSLAEQAALGVNAASSARAKIEALNKFLFEDSHFAPNEEYYFDPRNSYLNDVLNRRVGLPISLSLMYLEVGRRLGLPLHGVGLPGHFVVKWQDANDEIFIDPFHGGRVLDEAGLTRLLEGLQRQRLQVQRDWFDAVGARYILTRLLTNLKAIYLSSENYDRALPVAEKLYLLEPRSEENLRDVAVLSFRGGFPQRARVLFEDYLLNHPHTVTSIHVAIYLTSALIIVEKGS
jgi:regulator of sirC expression with transglutaminase-like and TPR domain